MSATHIEPEVNRWEWITLGSIGAAFLVLRLLALFRYRIDSDESQHLHVAWGWSEGLVQYRDVFDNHAPLLHMLSAPVVGLLGELPDVVIRMRMTMIPLFLTVAVSAFVIARRLYSTRVAWWTVAVVACYPAFFLKSLEYRTDNLWSALWMLALLSSGSTPRRRMLAGFVLGCAACASMKTIGLVVALAAATLVTHFLFDRERAGVLVRLLAAPAAAFLIPPLTLGAFFRLQGAWRPMLYCVFEFNLLATKTHPHTRAAYLLYPVCLLLMVLLAARVAERTRDDARQRGRFRIGFLVVTFFVTTQAFWPILSQRDYLAVMPLMAMFLVAWAFALPWRPVGTAAIAILTLLFLASLFRYTDRFRDHAGEQVAMMRQVLAMTRRGDCVMDLKGETIYRPRPFYYALETIARSAISSRVIPDTIPEAVIARRCHVAGADIASFPPRGRAFLTAHFIGLGPLRASGQWIGSDGSFTVAIPGRYVIAGRNGLARGVLDGARLAGPVTLNAGMHRFIGATAGERVAFLWADAFERGYSPFAD